MNEELKHHIYTIIGQLLELDTHTVYYVMLLVTVLIVLDDIARVLKVKAKSSGLNASRSRSVKVDGAKRHKAKTYISEIQGISGRPDAVLLENGYFIPVERKPIGNKVRDRHVAQLLVYMRLIEEFEGKRPPYGYLVLGKNARKVKIYNTEERQNWLNVQLQKMREIVTEQSFAEPKPHPKKCSRCSVRENCSAQFTGRVSNEEHLVKINALQSGTS